MEEVALKSGRRVRGSGNIEEESAELLARAEDLASAGSAPARVGGGKIEQLQCTRKSAVKTSGATRRMRADRSIYLAANVGELLYERKRRPPRAEPWVNECAGRHGSRTSRATTPRMDSRISASSTPRLRFPWAGRTLIMESNSIHPSPVSSGYKLMPQRSG